MKDMTIGEVDQSGANSSQILDEANSHRLEDSKNEKHRHPQTLQCYFTLLSKMQLN